MQSPPPPVWEPLVFLKYFWQKYENFRVFLGWFKGCFWVITELGIGLLPPAPLWEKYPLFPASPREYLYLYLYLIVAQCIREEGIREEFCKGVLSAHGQHHYLPPRPSSTSPSKSPPDHIDENNATPKMIRKSFNDQIVHRRLHRARLLRRLRSAGSWARSPLTADSPTTPTVAEKPKR